ncbi:MAG: ribosome rescue protein RqcH [Halobacteriales archaeon]
MEPRRELASVDIAAVVRELGDLAGAYFDKAYLYPASDLVRLKLRHPDRGRLELLASVGETKRIHLADPARVPAAPDRPPNFAKMLRNHLRGGTLAGVEQLGFDRIVRLVADVPDGEVAVVVELFGEGNVVAVGTDGTVVDCLRTVRLRSRTVAPGQAYEPPSQRVDPFALSRDDLTAEFDDSAADVVRTLAAQLNLGGRYAEEVCARAGVEMNAPAAEADASVVDALAGEIERLAADLEAGAFEPRVYEDDHGVVDVSPFELAVLADLEARAYETVSGAFDDYFRHLPERVSETDRADAGADAERERKERILEHQRAAVEGFRTEAETLRAQAEALYAHYDLVDEVIRTVRTAREDGLPWDAIEARLEEGAEAGIEAARAVVDVDPEAGRVTVDLDGYRVAVEVAEGVEHNASRLYRAAKATEKKVEGALAAIEETEADLEALEADSSTTPEARDHEPRDWLTRSSIPIRAPEHWYERFRWFHTSDGFLVVGGRSAKQNEELVHKYTEPGDLVFHAQAHGGPMAVLKATAPDEPAREVDFPEASREQTAQFAVSYASVWKDGHFAGDAYAVRPAQLTKAAESGEYLDTGAFAVRGERTYYRDVPVGVAVGVACEPETRVLGGPPATVRDRVAIFADLEPGRFAQADVAKRLYRRFREAFADETFVRKVASPDRIQPFLPPGGSRIVDVDGR